MKVAIYTFCLLKIAMSNNQIIAPNQVVILISLQDKRPFPQKRIFVVQIDNLHNRLTLNLAKKNERLITSCTETQKKYSKTP